MLRTGELLEFVPGMVVTQHSGSGKANQYFLRGFNLDHGTDFNTQIDGMPINMRTHGRVRLRVFKKQAEGSCLHNQYLKRL